MSDLDLDFIQPQDFHDWDCDRFRTYDHGLRQGTCDCGAAVAVSALVAALREARAEVERLRGDALAVLHDADLTYSLVTEAADGPVPGPMRTDADAIARALGIDRITGGAVAASVADEYRAHRDRERERRIHWEKQTIRAEAERDDWRRRYEALRDGVLAWSFDPVTRENEDGTRSIIWPDKAELRAVVARVEGDES